MKMGSSLSDAEILEKLHKFFGHSRFKSEIQRKAVKAILQGNQDIYVSMPTGSGKSLCYQLPSVLQVNKVAVVFSPLIALMKDQIDHLQNLKIRADSLNSKMSEKERSAVINDLRSIKPDIKLLYVAPEQAQTPIFTSVIDNLFRRQMLSYMIVDEAHCVSQWGHDFRTDYLKLGTLKTKYPGVSWIALTATASHDVDPEPSQPLYTWHLTQKIVPTEFGQLLSQQTHALTTQVQKDIIKNLHLKEPIGIFKVPCFRPNLFYDVVFRDIMVDDLENLKSFVQESLDLGKDVKSVRPKERSCGIIYCRTRESTEEIAEQLTKKGIVVRAYHAGLSGRERMQVQDDWMDGKYPVISATVSFGMGIDKSSVRFVVHWGMPQSVAAYYQESGRAGRDGLPSNCRIYYSKSERDKVDFLLKMEAGRAKTANKKEKAKLTYKSYERMVRYCEEARCRHSVFAEYFGDDTPPCKKQCDVCVDKKKIEKLIEDYQNKTSMYKTKALRLTDDDGDLYGGGRRGQRDESDFYSDDQKSNEDNKAKKDLEGLIKKQFSLRKNNQHESDQEKETAKYSKVKAAASTTVKVNGLTISARENFLDLVTDALHKNLLRSDPTNDNGIHKLDCEACAIDLEYDAFSSCKVASLYRRAVFKTISSIKKCTEDGVCYVLLTEYKGKGSSNKESLNSLVQNSTSTSHKTPQFVTASQLVKQKEEKKDKPKANLKDRFSIKKRLLNQKSIDGYFQPQNSDINGKEDGEVWSSPSPEEKSAPEDKEFNIEAYTNEEIEEQRRMLEAFIKNVTQIEAQNEIKCKEEMKQDIVPKEAPTPRCSQSEEEQLCHESPIHRPESDKRKCDAADINASKKVKTEVNKITELFGDESNEDSRTESLDARLFGELKVKERETHSSNSVSKHRKQFSTKDRVTVSELVVKHLMPTYKHRKLITSKEKFKELAKNMTQTLLEAKGPKTSESDVKNYIQKYFKKLVSR